MADESAQLSPTPGLHCLLPGSRMSVARPRSSHRFASLAVASKNNAAASTAPADRTVAMKPASDVFAGAVARAASQSTIHPLDTLKVRMQTAGGITAGVSKIGQLLPPVGAKEKVATLFCSIRSLYTGVAGAASGAGIALGAYFACYGAATNTLLRFTDLPASSIAFCAGGVAAAGSSVVKVPLAVCIRSVQAGVYPNVFDAVQTITKAAGPRGLFCGFTPTLLEDVPDMAVKFAAYESLRQLHSRMNDGRKANPSEDFAMGAVSGAFAAAATTPLDVIKTNMMCNASSNPSMASAARAVYSQGGISAFARGIGPRAISNGINSAVFFCFFEAIRSYIARQAEVKKEEEAAKKLEVQNERLSSAPALSLPCFRATGEELAVDWDLEQQLKPVGASVSMSAVNPRRPLLPLSLPFTGGRFDPPWSLQCNDFVMRIQ